MERQADWMAPWLGAVLAATAAGAFGADLDLPKPQTDGQVAVERALDERRSIRRFTSVPLTLTEVSQVLWAAQGITNRRGYRTAPSAGGLYPLEVYLVARNVEGLAAGTYRYRPDDHRLRPVASGDPGPALASAALDQQWVHRAPVVLVIAGVYSRTTGKYGQRGRRYVHIETGHAAQNVYLQAEALGLATVMVGAFSDTEVRAALDLPDDHVPLALMPLGHRR